LCGDHFTHQVLFAVLSIGTHADDYPALWASTQRLYRGAESSSSRGTLDRLYTEGDTASCWESQPC
jgi:hypothetical protein